MKILDSINNSSCTIYTGTQGKKLLITRFLSFLREILIDPPAFTKDKETVKKAYRGYKEINLSALKLVRSGGYLLTFSCSQHMTPSLFMEMVKDAAHDANREVQMVDFRIQSPDHPSRLESIEQLYLKCIILRVK